MKLFYGPEIRLRHDEYEKLIDAQKRAQAIIEQSEREEEHMRWLTDYGHGKAIFRTKDGLEAIDKNPNQRYYRRVVREQPKLAAITDSPECSTIQIRNYEYAGKTIKGLPVFEEV